MSSKNKLCIIFNVAPHYREAIFKLIEQNYDCDWYFGENNTNIKSMDTSSLKNVKFQHIKNIYGNKLFIREGLSNLLKSNEYNTYLVTGETFNLSVWWMLLKSKMFYPSKRIYLWSHGWYGKESTFIRFLKRIYFNLADGVFLYGNYAKQLMKKEGLDEHKLYVIHNSLQYDYHLSIRNTITSNDLYKNHFQNDNRNIVFIGRLTKVKKLELLIETISVLKNQGQSINLTFIGDGTEKENLMNLVVQKGLNAQVWFYGACYDDCINADLIYNADICVSPGNVGLTAIHTMTFGTPVLTHNNFSLQMPEFETIQKGVTGDFFEKDNINSIANCISNWFREHPDREIVRQNCYKEIAKSWNPSFQIKILSENLKFK